jgi:hypothetical protein
MNRLINLDMMFVERLQVNNPQNFKRETQGTKKKCTQSMQKKHFYGLGPFKNLVGKEFERVFH